MFAGNSIEVRPEQFANAQSPISVTSYGILTPVSFVQFSNAFSLIFVTVGGMVYSPDFPRGQNITSVKSLLNRTPFFDEY